MAVISKLSSLLDLAKERSSDRRRTLLREVTDMFFDEAPERESALSQEFDCVLSTLAEQTAQGARAELAERFADAPHAPAGMLLQLARDAIEVAAPILARSTALSEADLLSIAELGAQPQLKAISRRELVSERLSDTIVRRGDDETIAVLIRNDGAQLSRKTFETVTERAEQSKVLRAPIVKRKDTPADLLGDLMLTVENHLRDHILERFEGMEPALVEQALAASHARLGERISQDKDLEEARKYVRAMAVRKLLDGALLARLLRERAMTKFQVAFAELTNVDLVAARRAIEQDCIDPLALICRSAGFDKALFVTLAVLRSTATEDAFRDAKDLGLLYDRITVEDAARAMRFWRMRRDVAA
ncbi:DUF2336 domain-containing protein [uncultured Maricaulis sp.]|uniref:DUF2336 domain-containing protein n=1 Tax=uncultured Maricaulis sp. TaxID=174710 RepID=UPI0030D91F70|tara:strand:- start:115935 stop:117017 length:1083 start_codon:yes stop_codon:yes gene_type:complete